MSLLGQVVVELLYKGRVLAAVNKHIVARTDSFVVVVNHRFNASTANACVSGQVLVVLAVVVKIFAYVTCHPQLVVQLQNLVVVFEFCAIYIFDAASMSGILFWLL